MEQGHGTVTLCHGAQFGQGDGVVAAHDHRDGPGAEHARNGGFDTLEGLVEIAGDDVHVARINALAVLENVHVKNAVVRFQDTGGVPNGRRAEPASRPIRGRRVERHAEHGEIVAGAVGGMRQALKGADPAETGGSQ